MRSAPLPPRVCALAPLAGVTLALTGWLVSCGPDGSSPELVRKTGQKLDAYCTVPVTGIGTLDVETDYLPHVVHCENGGAPYESLKAQAVAARSFLYYKLETAGSVIDGQGDQVYSCGSGPSQEQIQAVKDTSGQFISYQGVTVCTFFVAGSKQSPPECKGANNAATEKYVTYNWGLSGDSITQTSLGWVSPTNKRNRGCLSQWGSRCLNDAGWVYTDMLKFYYGMDAKLETATGSCVVATNAPAKGNVDGIDCSSIRGWAQDPDEPTKVVEVRVSLDGPAGDPNAKTITVSAQLDRADLCAPLGSCNHGFQVRTPLGLSDGKAHSVHVEAVDTAGGGPASISGSPGTMTCAPPTPPLTAAHGVRRHVTSAEVFSAWHFSTLEDVAHLSDSELNAYPIGSELPATPALTKGDDGTAEVWLLDTGTRRHVPSPEVMTAWRFDSTTIGSMPAAQLYALPNKPPVRPLPFLMQGSGPAIYLLDDPIDGGSVPSQDSGLGGAGGSGGSGQAGKDASAESGQGGMDSGTAGGAGSLFNKNGTQEEGCACNAVGSGPTSAAGWLIALPLVFGLTRKRRRLTK